MITFDFPEEEDRAPIRGEVYVVPRIGETVGVVRDPHGSENTFRLHKVGDVRHYVGVDDGTPYHDIRVLLVSS